MRIAVVLTVILLVFNVISITACSPTKTTLDGTRWTLESYSEQGELHAVLDGTEITVSFNGAEKQAGGSAGCNTYSSNYKITGSKLSFSAIASTEMYCDTPEGVMEQEREYLALLLEATTFVVDNNRLTVLTSNGQVLIYSVIE